MVASSRLKTADSASPMTAPAGDDASGAPDNEAHHVASGRAERRPHPEIAHAQLNRIREDAEDADHGQRHGQRGEYASPSRRGSDDGRRRPIHVLECRHVATLTSCSLSMREIAPRTAGVNARRGRSPVGRP